MSTFTQTGNYSWFSDSWLLLVPDTSVAHTAWSLLARYRQLHYRTRMKPRRVTSAVLTHDETRRIDGSTKWQRHGLAAAYFRPFIDLQPRDTAEHPPLTPKDRPRIISNSLLASGVARVRVPADFSPRNGRPSGQVNERRSRSREGLFCCWRSWDVCVITMWCGVKYGRQQGCIGPA